MASDVLKPKNVKFIVVHCSDTPDNPSSRWYNMGVKVLDEWHKIRFAPVCDHGVKKYVGYHIIIKKDGTIEKGRGEEFRGKQATGFNWRSISICVIGRGRATFTGSMFSESAGGIDDVCTMAQKETLNSEIARLMSKYGVPINNVIGHHDTYPMRGKKIVKTCPGFSIHKHLTGNFFSWES